MLATMTGSTASVQWGDVATWVGSFATSGALLLTYGLLRITRKDQRALQADQRISQARKVSAWCESTTPAGASGHLTAVVRFQNASDEPIYGARVAVAGDWLNPESMYTELDLSYVTPPHYSEARAVEVRTDQPPGGITGATLPVEMIFSDASGGRFWHRDRYGGLTEITRGLPPVGRDHFFKTPKNTL
jgi:hypothetical protein